VTETLRLQRERVDWREIDDEIVALDLESSTYLSINRTGRLIWSALERGATRDELLESLTRTYRVDRKRAAADLDAFLAGLRERGLLSSEA
jgi:hypothetical protein